MSRLAILQYDHPTIRRPSEPVREVDGDIERLIADMIETMYVASGVGLAAPQVGVAKQVVVLNPSTTQDRATLQVLLNPQIAMAEGHGYSQEACLSIPGVHEMIPRAERVVVQGLDRSGHPIELDASGLLARILQHE
ncbi:MAG: peptide deformylase, partial [Candidatus Methylomirabilales bacterium]